MPAIAAVVTIATTVGRGDCFSTVPAPKGCHPRTHWAAAVWDNLLTFSVFCFSHQQN